MSDPLSLRILRYLPRNALSRLVGILAAMERPRWVIRQVQRWFVERYGLDMDEAEFPLEDYPSLLAMFTRRLRPGSRPIDREPDALVSPVDGRIGAFGVITEGRLVQAKGMEYSTAALLGSAEAARAFQGGHFMTIYLAPHDYHRIHSPVEGRIRTTMYEPGTLWPVNPPAVRTIPRLFAVNERVISMVEGHLGDVAVCMVGATNVGSIRLAYDDLVTNRNGVAHTERHVPAPAVDRGDHIGTFELGSTVVLLVAPGRDPFGWRGVLEEGDEVRLGGVLGRYARSHQTGRRAPATS